MDVSLFGPIATEIVRIATGRLLTESQISSISTHAVGRYLADLFPEPEDSRNAKEKIHAAQSHIESAGLIIHDLRSELDAQTAQLTALIEEIEEKKSLAQRYSLLANSNQEQFGAFRREMEETVRKELSDRANAGKRARQIFALSAWLFTLILGAALGTYFKDLVAWLNEVLT